MDEGEEKIISFPQKPDSGKLRGDFSNIVIGDREVVNLPENVSSINTEDFAKKVKHTIWKENALRILRETNLPEIPSNLYNIRNGTIIVAMEPIKSFENNLNFNVVLFYDGNFVRAGDLHGSLKWTLHQLIEEINNGVWKVVGNIND